jgi:hypothetical protein
MSYRRASFLLELAESFPIIELGGFLLEFPELVPITVLGDFLLSYTYVSQSSIPYLGYM